MTVDEFNEENFPEEFENEVLNEHLLTVGDNPKFYSSKELNKLIL